jgi:hypothetical protein
MAPTASQSDVDPIPLKREETFIEDVDVEKTHTGGSLHVMATYHSYSPEFSAQVEKKLLRRIDTRIMPLVVLIYIFSYLDRNSVSNVAVPD